MRRHIPGVRFAGIVHPGLIGTAPSHELLSIWNERERALEASGKTGLTDVLHTRPLGMKVICLILHIYVQAHTYTYEHVLCFACNGLPASCNETFCMLCCLCSTMTAAEGERRVHSC
jgi:hypothetical protein